VVSLSAAAVPVFTSGADGYKGYRIPSVIRAANGDLLAFAEARKNGLGDAGDIDLVLKRSTDGGLSWSPVVPSPVLVEPVCQASLLRHSWPAAGKPGLLLFSNPASKTAREKMTVHFSWDDGKTWPQSLLLDAGFAAYSCLIKLTETEAACLYEAGSGDPKKPGRYRRILFTKFPIPNQNRE
jgi:hypothetical protein